MVNYFIVFISRDYIYSSTINSVVYIVTLSLLIALLIACYTVTQASFDDKNMMNAIWGKLACEILMQNWDVALEDLNRLKETIESTVSCL